MFDKKNIFIAFLTLINFTLFIILVLFWILILLLKVIIIPLRLLLVYLISVESIFYVVNVKILNHTRFQMDLLQNFHFIKL